MAVANMRHYNSPEELAKRQGSPDESREPHRGFRHYNHPEEVAKRAAAASGRSAPTRRTIVTSGRPMPPPLLKGWPPAGEDNTAEVFEGEPPAPAVQPSGDHEDRLARLETLVGVFLEDEREAREFRLLLNNFAAVTESQGDMIGRVKALETTLDALAEEAEADDDEKPPTNPSPRGPVTPPTEPTT